MAHPDACIRRIKRELQNPRPAPGICIAADEEDMTKVHALIILPSASPCRGGFFYFILHFPSSYPFRPPNVELMTTGGGRVQFNPNFHADGKVCLSIPGTCEGPDWSAAMSLSSILLSIQSLMDAKPSNNIPDMMKKKIRKTDQRYKQTIQHETLRVAVVGMLEETPASLPKLLRDEMLNIFSDRYRYYVTTCKNALSLENTPMHDTLGANNGMFDHGSIIQRLEKLKEKLEEEGQNTTDKNKLDKDQDNARSRNL